MLDYSRYPDVTAAGDLRRALQDVLDATGTPLRAEHVASPGWLLTNAVVRAGDRSVSVHLTSGDRAFGVDFWTPGLQMAHGLTPDLPAAAAATAMFLDGARVRQIGAAWPFVEFGPLAEAFERGEPEAIAVRWQQLLDQPLRLSGLHAFLVAASDEPRLRALYPFTSLGDLGFRRSVPDGKGRALAWVRSLGGGRYLVSGPDRRWYDRPRRGTDWDTDPVAGALGPASAPESVPLLLTALDRAEATPPTGD